MVSRVQYEAAKNLFRIPLLLAPNQKVTFTLTGFRSASGVPVAPIKFQYEVSGEELANADREMMEADAREPRLLKVLDTIKQKRSKLTSLAEHVQNLMLTQENGLFYRLQSQNATFKWQKPDRFYADITGPMMMSSDFRIGSDGQRWWSIDDTNFVVCSVQEIQNLDIAISDPFSLTHLTPGVTAAQLKLKYDGLSRLGDAHYFQMEAWHMGRITKGAPFGSIIQWWIDTKYYRPAQITVFDSGCVSRLRFLYDSINEPLPAADFAVPKLKGLSPTPPEPLVADYTERFINLRDGSDGNMNVEYGKKSPKGRSGNGFIMDGY
jgi:outer membrane lipoprotein-sorting protein